ncbi:DUF3558 family protein [Bounagaea algeriensis]
MSGRGAWLVAAVLVLTGLATACGSSDRPRELSLDDVDACNLVSRSDFAELGVNAEPLSIDVVEGANKEGTTCEYSPQSATVSVAAVTNQGIERWTNGSMESFTATDVPRIQGYRTVQVQVADVPSGPHDMCTLYVDAAENQSVKVAAGPNSEGDPPTCETARQFAGAAISTLSANQA